MAKLYNLARMSTATTGTGTITLGSAVTGFITFTAAGIADGDTVTYAIQDGSASEIGRGVYTASGTTLTRSVLKSTNSGSAINLSGQAQIFITPAAEDFFQNAAGTSTDNAVARWDGTGGNTLQNSAVTVADTGATTITAAVASALAVGRQGATDPVLSVDASTASVATGLKITGAAAAGGVAVAAISSGTNEAMTINAKGSGTITIGNSSTGDIVHGQETSFPAGAVGAPSIYAAGDANTGVWFPAADTIAASTGGSERVRVDSSGNFGVGTTSPSKKFVVSDSGNMGIEISPNDGGGAVNRLLSYNRGTSAYSQVQWEALDHIFSAGSSYSERLRIASGGNVGVGVAAPAHKLSVEGITAPASNNSYTLGASGYRWSEVFAVNGTINTSDARKKIVSGPISGASALAFLSAIEPVFYQWREAVNEISYENETYEDQEPVTENIEIQEEKISIVDGAAKVEIVTRTEQRQVFDDLPVVTSDGTPLLDANGAQRIHRAPRMRTVQKTRLKKIATPRPGVRRHAGVTAQSVRSAMLANGLDCAAWCLDDKDNPESDQSIRPDQLMFIMWAAVRHLVSLIATPDPA